MAINTQKFLPPAKGGALIKASQKVISAKKGSSITLTEKSVKDIANIRVSVIRFESILKGTLAVEKKKLDEKKRKESGKRREKQEEKLETKSNVEKGQIKMPKRPRLGIFDWIKNFIKNIILGYFAVRLIDHLPKIMPIVKFLGSAADFIINVGGKLLNGLVTFVDWGYKAIDATRGFIKNLGGENFAQGFDKFIGAVDTVLFLSTVLATELATDALTDKGTPGGEIARKPAGVFGRGAARAATRFGLKTIGKGGTKAVLRAVRPLVRNAPLIGGLLEFGISWALGDPLPKAAFRGVGTALLGAVGTAIGGPIGLAIGGYAGGELGGVLYDMFFNNKKPSQKGKVQGKAGGGITRGGKTQGGVRRTIAKQKYKRVVKKIPREPGKVEIKSDTDVGQKEKVFDLFGFVKNAVQAINPFNTIKKSGEELGKTDYFGPILAVTSKLTLGQELTQRDYQNVGLGINMLIAKGIQEKQLKGGIIAAFAEGGFVDPDVLSAAETGGDISNWVSKTFKGEVESNAQKTLRMIRENSEKKKLKQREEEISPTGDMQDAVISESEMDLFQRLVVAESGGQGLIGQALVARSVLNRAGLIQSGKATKGTFNAKDGTVTGVITGRGQYQPYADGNPNGSINRPRTQTQMSAAKDAIKLAQDPNKLKSLLKSEGLDDGTVNKLLAATGFRAGYAFDDPSQNVNVVKYKDHYFNTAGNAALIVASSQVSEKINPISLKGGDGSFIQGNSGRSDGTHFHIGTTKPGDGSGVSAAGFNVIKHFLGKKSVYVGRSGEFIPANATDDQIRGYIGRGQAAHRQTELDLQIGGIGAGNKVAFPLALKNMRYSETDGYGVSADIVGVNAFVGHGRYKPDGTLALQQRRTLNLGAPDFYAFHGMNRLMTKDGLLKFHKGEYISVTDADSFRLVGNILTDINSVENKAQLVARAPSIIEKLKAISGYASYEEGSQETIVISTPTPSIETDYDSYGSSSGVAFIPVGGGSDDPYETLYEGG